MAEDGSPVAQEEAWMPTSMYRSRHQPQDPWGPLLQPLHGHITTGLSPHLISTLHKFPQAHLTPFLGLIRHQETHWPTLMPATHGSAPTADEASDEGLNISFPLGKLLWDFLGT